MKRIVLTLAAALIAATVASAGTALFAQSLDGMRGPTPIPQEPAAPLMSPMRNTTEREIRNFPEQPPLIPHSTEGYQVDLNSNKCLTCHSRVRTGESQAPMISVTHFMDRDGQPLASVSPRRFFCNQCHVPQHDVKLPITNDFVDIDTLLSRARPGGQR